VTGLIRHVRQIADGGVSINRVTHG
jgi:hypothetical protein